MGVGEEEGGAAAIHAGVSLSQQPAAARSPQPTMPSSKSGSEFWIDGSHREAALEDFYIVGPELGRYREGRAGREGLRGAGIPPVGWERVLGGAGTVLVGRGMEGGWREAGGDGEMWGGVEEYGGDGFGVGGIRVGDG